MFINVNMSFEVNFSEVELAEDLKGFISFNADSCTETLKITILNYNNDDLIKVTKKVASPIKITNVELITDELLNEAI